MKEFRAAKKRIEVSVGESVRILRELQERTHVPRIHVLAEFGEDLVPFRILECR